jgi:hypothetical protein
MPGPGHVKHWNQLPFTHKFSAEKQENRGNVDAIRFKAKGDAILSATLLGPSWYVDAVRGREGPSRLLLRWSHFGRAGGMSVEQSTPDIRRRE